MAGVDVEVLVAGGVVRTGQEQHPVKGDVVHGHRRALVVLQRIEGRIRLYGFHNIHQDVGNTFIIDVHSQLFLQIGRIDQILEGGLPRLDFFAVGILCYVVKLKDTLVLKIQHIATDLIITAVQIVSAVIGRVQRVVAYGVQHTAHGGKLVVRKINGLGLCQGRTGIEHIDHPLHQHIGELQHGEQDHIQRENDENALKHGAKNSTHGRLDLIRSVEHFPNHRNNGKGKAQYHTNDRHTPVNAGNGAVFEKYIGQIVILAVVGDLHLTGENLEQLIHHGDEPVHCGNYAVKNLANGVIQRCIDQISD